MQYGELAQLFHQWLAVHRPVGQIDLTREAVVNTMRGSSNDTFESIISECLSESLRTLRSDGVLVLTFHNRRIAAWRALAAALRRAGFRVNAMATVHSENGNDHCKRNVDAMLDDIVLECKRRSRVTASPKVTHPPRTVAQKNLIAMGLALASAVKNGQLTSLANEYTTNLAKLNGRRRIIA
ncbi:adenine-specific DNA methylase [mine drainage metagenome]|uniref:Adenine-specific DNA methylase n=1 Tax=mine drainage metagenome TaxID=410659 RepID=T1AW39_9ZZZZ